MKESLLFLLISLMSLQVLAQTQTGDIIKANHFNNSTFQVGDIKKSLLSEIVFQSTHGDCWVRMRGQDISGSDFASLMEVSHLPDASQSGGVFFRETSGERVLGSIQEDATKLPNAGFSTNSAGAHTHTPASGSVLTSAGSSYARFMDGAKGDRAYTNTLSSAGAHTHTISGGDAETRPVNLSVNYFIKINNECN